MKHRGNRFAPFVTLLALTGPAATGSAQGVEVAITVNIAAGRHKIDPRIYGLAYATPEQLRDLNAPLNRMGGNNTSRYNWKLNADNRGNDWFFESIPDDNATPGERGDSFVTRSLAGGAQPMLTVPMLDWIAKVGPNRQKLPGFSTAKYGAQQKTDPYMSEAGNGKRPDGKDVVGNDPADANLRNSPAFEAEWVRHLVERHGTATKGGVRYYILDNEPGIWHGTHRDVQPVGIKAEALRDRIIAYAGAIKSVDPGAQVVGPEEWGWTGYVYSPYDSWYGGKHGWTNLPERTGLLGGKDFMPWLLAELRKSHEKTGKRLIDIFTTHIYPQGGEFGDDVSADMQARRNRSTRALWDPNYKDETWINEKVQLIPRMKEWVRNNYPGTPIGITEYNWGAEKHINGATAQADILGIFGREGVDLAARWTTPPTDSPVYNAIKLYRNYDGNRSAFGDVSVQAAAPDTNDLSAFAAVRSSDGAVTIMLIAKAGSIAVNLNLPGVSGAAQLRQLKADNRITRLGDMRVRDGRLRLVLPGQSITLIVVPKA